MCNRLPRILTLEPGADLYLLFQALAHRLDEWEEGVLGIDRLDQFFGPRQEKLAEPRVGQERLREVPSGPPPDRPDCDPLRDRQQSWPPWRPVALHAERH